MFTQINKIMKDKTVPIAIAITIAIIVIIGIIVGVSCKDKFMNVPRRNIGLFENIPNQPKSISQELFQKWYSVLREKEKDLTIEEAKERYNKLIGDYSDFLVKPIDQLSDEQKKQRQLFQNLIPGDYQQIINNFGNVNKV